MLTAIGVHALSSVGEFLIWRSIPNSPNHQIKNLAKVSRYTVNPYSTEICSTEILSLYRLILQTSATESSRTLSYRSNEPVQV